MANVSTHVNGKVTSDGTWSGLQWVGSTKNGSTLLDNVLTLPNGGEDWAGKHVRQQGWEEWLLSQVGVVGLQQGLSWGNELDTDELETSVLESTEDRGDQTSLDTVWLERGLVAGGSGKWSLRTLQRHVGITPQLNSTER